jgi:DNA-binding NarL/FixJ family response regulator
MLAVVIDVVLVHGSGLLREALHERLDQEPDLGVSSAVARGCDVPSSLTRGGDVVICEAALFEPGDGQRWLAEGVGVVLVAEPTDEQQIVPAVVSGVRGWTSKDDPYESLLQAVRCVARGGTQIPEQLLTLLLAELTVARRGPLGGHKITPLTDRERQVLRALADGRTRAEVAIALHVSTNTVRTHVRRILAKLEVHSALSAVAVGRRLGVLDPPQ